MQVHDITAASFFNTSCKHSCFLILRHHNFYWALLYQPFSPLMHRIRWWELEHNRKGGQRIDQWTKHCSFVCCKHSPKIVMYDCRLMALLDSSSWYITTHKQNTARVGTYPCPWTTASSDLMIVIHRGESWLMLVIHNGEICENIEPDLLTGREASSDLMIVIHRGESWLKLVIHKGEICDNIEPGKGSQLSREIFRRPHPQETYATRFKIFWQTFFQNWDFGW